MPTVLVVEDDPIIAWRLRRLLMTRGVRRVIHAETVAEALEMLIPSPDWAILDMNLADGLGLTVLETIRRAGLPIRVIVSSATTDASLLAAVALYQPDFILPKPLNPALLPF
jgi:CheY-like chemotaxis protein